MNPEWVQAFAQCGIFVLLLASLLAGRFPR